MNFAEELEELILSSDMDPGDSEDPESFDDLPQVHFIECTDSKGNIALKVT
jgi:hypothetical protein